MSRTLQMALDALEWLLANIRRNAPELSGKAMGNAEVAITALREALAAPEPEPVARVAEVHMSRYTIEWTNGPLPEGTGLYAAPPAAPAPAAPVVPLTDEQIRSKWMSSEFRGNGGQVDWFCEGIRAAEAHHGITGGKP